jgi:preprotein translocase subunit YajC
MGEQNMPQGSASIISLIIWVAFFGLMMYFLVILPQKKRDKKARELINSLKVGDKVTTIGGVYGKVINIKDDEVTVETSVEKTQIVFKNWAIKEVEKPIEA